MRFFRPGLNLLAAFAVFAGFAWLHDTAGGAEPALWTRESTISVIISAVTFALVARPASDFVNDWLRLWIEQFLTTLGSILVVQAAWAYLFHTEPMSWVVVLGGTLLTLVLVFLLGADSGRARRKMRPDTLLIGCDDSIEPLLPTLRHRLLGVLCESGAALPEGVVRLGSVDDLPQIAEAHDVRRILLLRGALPGRMAGPLGQLRARGVVVEDPADLYENALGRIPWSRLEPTELLFCSSMNTTGSVMALQAVYNNLVGLTLLFLALPLLAVIAVLVALLSGPGPIIERVECAGLQRIPFHLRRFRTHYTNGEPTGIGKVLYRLRLINLPNLINIVRGEIGLFGPPPARLAFAEHLCSLLPQYSQRFLMKPGVIGWAQVNLHRLPEFPDELARLEYDLYYVKCGNLSLDAEILLRSMVQTYSGGGQIRS